MASLPVYTSRRCKSHRCRGLPRPCSMLYSSGCLRSYKISCSCYVPLSFCLFLSLCIPVWALACRPFHGSILPERNAKINSKLKSSQIVHNLVQWSTLALFKFISWYETIRLQFSFRFHISIWITQIKKSVKIISWYEILSFYTFIFFISWYNSIL